MARRGSGGAGSAGAGSSGAGRSVAPGVVSKGAPDSPDVRRQPVGRISMYSPWRLARSRRSAPSADQAVRRKVATAARRESRRASASRWRQMADQAWAVGMRSRRAEARVSNQVRKTVERTEKVRKPKGEAAGGRPKAREAGGGRGGA